MSNTFIRNCSWGYSCDKKWNDMINTDTNGVKFCGDCQREVFSTENVNELAKNIALNRCVYFSNDLIESSSGKNSWVIGKPDQPQQEHPTLSNSSDFDVFDDDIPF